MSATVTQSDSRPATPRSGPWLGVSVVAGIACAAIGFATPAAFWTGYLVAAVFWMSISAGCLGITLVHGVSGGRWGRFIGRALHAGLGTLWFSLLACWVLALAAGYVFPWAGAYGHLNKHQQVWLSPAVVGIRFAVICLIWLAYSTWLNARYRRDAADPVSEMPQVVPAIGVLLFFISFSIVAIDFMMALSPAWASSMYPVIRIMNCAVSAMAVCAIATNRNLINPDAEKIGRVLDIGNLLQAFNLLWTYTSFSQYILIWTGDIASEVEYYMQRRTPFWFPVSFILFGLHFVLPFLLLLARSVKKGPVAQTRVAWLLLVMCFLDVAWTLLPSTPVATFPAMASAVLATAAIGGIWIFLFQRSFAVLPDMAMEDDEHAEAHHAIHPISGDTI